MYQDSDGTPSGSMAAFMSDLRKSLAVAESDGLDPLRTTFVVAALEYTSTAAAERAPEGNVDKQRLRALWQAGEVSVMHPCCFGYSGPFNLADWFDSPAGYTLHYQQSYEPYYIMRAPVFLFDERFVGRHHNKHSLFFELYAAGYGLHVLADSWVVDTPHDKSLGGSSSRGKVEPVNRRKWAQFLSETAARYGLQCPAKGPCWWAEEGIENWGPLLDAREMVLQATSC
jgi:hypothetical protein